MALHEFMENFKPFNPMPTKGNKSGTMKDFKSPNAMAPIAPAKFQSGTVPNSISQPVKVPMKDGTSGVK